MPGGGSAFLVCRHFTLYRHRPRCEFLFAPQVSFEDSPTSPADSGYAPTSPAEEEIKEDLKAEKKEETKEELKEEPRTNANDCDASDTENSVQTDIEPLSDDERTVFNPSDSDTTDIGDSQSGPPVETTSTARQDPAHVAGADPVSPGSGAVPTLDGCAGLPSQENSHGPVPIAAPNHFIVFRSQGS